MVTILGLFSPSYTGIRPCNRHRAPAPDYLFSYRGSALGASYLNHQLIPLLLRKANLEGWRDRHGPVTSHRARSTMTTILGTGENPMSLVELMVWLGHRRPESTLSYLATTPVELTRSYRSAMTNVGRLPVFLDLRAVREGTGDSDRPFLVVDVGVEKGGCSSIERWKNCINSMDCLGPACSHNLRPDSALMTRLRAGDEALRLTQEIMLSRSKLLRPVVPRRNRKSAQVTDQRLVTEVVGIRF